MKQEGGTVDAIMRGFFFQRLTARIFTADPAGWLLKGGQALLVRYPSGARLSKDIDLQHLGGSTDEALQALLAAAAIDLDDHLKFVPQRMTRQGAGGDGVNQAFDVYIGPRRLLSIHVDLVTNKMVTAEPQPFQLQPRPNLPWPTNWPQVRLYPVVDHLADKICAMYEWRGTAPSSRYRDLADILLISQNESISATEAHHALHTEAAHRSALSTPTELRLPKTLEMPAPTWRAGYTKAAKDVAGLKGCNTWDEAYSAADAFVTPILGSAFGGTWHPEKAEWVRDS